MSCPYKVGQEVILVGPDIRGRGHSLDGYFGGRPHILITNIRSHVESDASHYYMLGNVLNGPQKGDRIYFYSSMCESMWGKGDILLRSIHRNGVATEHGIPEKEYDQMDLAAIAARVLGSAPHVSGVKSRIETPDCCILTIGPYQP